jgi:hypothetical protein
MCGNHFRKNSCPICKSEAEEIEGDTFDGVWLRCLKHREFGVSDTALKTRKNAEPEQWEGALKKKRLSERAQNSDRKFSTLIFKKKSVAQRRRPLKGWTLSLHHQEDDVRFTPSSLPTTERRSNSGASFRI